VLLVAAALAWWAYDQAKEAVSIAGTPSEPSPAIAVGLQAVNAERRPLGDALPYHASATVELRRGCSNPVDVIVDISEAGTSSGPVGVRRTFDAAIAISDATIHTLRATRGPFTVVSAPKPIKTRRVEPLRPQLQPGTDPAFATGGIVGTTMIQATPIAALRVTFEANWVTNRGHRTCFVAVPDLGIGADTRARALLPVSGFVGHTGTVRMTSSRGELQPFESLPPPDDLRERVWNCSVEISETARPTSCGAIAVFEEANATGDAAARTFVFGALFGVLIALIIETVRRFRVPPSPQS
jgi:hypothetical protein